MKRNITGLLCGVIFVLAGLIYVGSILFDYNFTIFFHGWWTLFIIVPSFISILSNGPRGFSIGAFTVGVLLLLTQLGIIKDDYLGEFIFATIILSIGVSLIVHFVRGPKKNYNSYNSCNSGANYNANVNGSTDPNATYQANNNDTQAGNNDNKQRGTDPQDFPNYTAILSGVDARCTSTNFQGARISAILGGADIDLRSVVITQDITIYVTAFMGGVDILAPQNVRINVTRTDILGGTTMKAMSQPSDANVPLVTFETSTIMGGIEIK